MAPPWFLAPEQVTFAARPFARGIFGGIHRGKWLGTTNVVVRTLQLEGDQIDNEFVPQAELWSQLHHPHVLALYGACHTVQPPFMVCEDAPNGRFLEYLNKSPANAQNVWRLLFETAQALLYLHSKQIVHGNLQLANVLIAGDGSAKLTGFGLSRKITSSDEIKSLEQSWFMLGSLNWQAPECFEYQADFASDVYSLAMCIIEAFTREPPYRGAARDALSLISDGKLPSQPANMPDEGWELVRQMARLNPQERLDLATVVTTLKRFADREREAVAAALGVCDRCYAGLKPKAIFCSKCGVQVSDRGSRYGQYDQTLVLTLLGDLSDHPDLEKRTEAVKVLLSKLADERIRNDLREHDGVNKLINAAMNPDNPAVCILYIYAVIYGLHTRFGETNDDSLQSARNEVIKVEPSIVNEIRELIRTGERQAKVLAASLISLLASVGQASQVRLRHAGVVEELAAQLYGDDKSSAPAVSALAALAADNPEIQSYIVTFNLEQPIAETLHNRDDKVKRDAVYLLSVLASRGVRIPLGDQSANIRELIDIIQDGELEEKELAIETLAHMVETDQYALSAVASRGGVSLFVGELQLESATPKLLRHAILILGKLVTKPQLAQMAKFAGTDEILSKLLGGELQDSGVRSRAEQLLSQLRNEP